MKESCDDWRTLLSALLDGELSEQRQAALQSHVDACPGCREELSSVQEVARALAVRFEPDPFFVTRFRARRDRDPYALPWPWRKLALRLLPLAASAVLVAATAVWVSTEQNGLGELEARALGQLALEEVTVDAPGFGMPLEPFPDEEP
jgi:anti-sigma factor RsiW